MTIDFGAGGTPSRLVTAAEMRDLERLAIGDGCSVEQLMERAAQGIAMTILRMPASQLRSIMVVAGPGNNGGDALLAGQFLASAGCQVELWQWSRGRPAPAGMSLPVHRLESDAVPTFEASIRRATLVVDGLLGTGRNRPIDGSLRDVLRSLQAAPKQCFVVAVDLPTGVDADTGAADPDAVRADLTVTLGLAKPGLVQQPGARYAGQIVVVPLGLSLDALERVRGSVIDDSDVSRMLPDRPANSNKGTFGKLLVVGGSQHYTGAPYLAATAAGRAGAGLVTLAVPSSIQAILAPRAPEYTFEPLPEEEGSLGARALNHLREVIGRYDAVVLGPGLGQAQASIVTVRDLCVFLRDLEHPPKVVIDADALNALALAPNWWRLLPTGTVLTPHPGEMARLAGTSVADVQADRVAIARGRASTWRQCVVLKGAGTVVASADGAWSICPLAVPALATAGTGDVLAGAIGGLLAQGLDPFDAARSGVLLHARAGAIVAKRLGDSGLLASDLLPVLPKARQEIVANAAR